ncbi:MAG TPA: DUF4199 domain-containing protein [Steroidobacteraceae bacterium]|nr:DUF4199 domain-containing protein [Steroidobacteraceae bacterium]
MLSYIVRYGIIAGLIVGTPMVWGMLSAKPGDVPVFGMLVAYLIMIVALSSVFVGVKAYRDKVLGGVIRFLPALGVGLGISAVASILYAVAWEISSAYSSFDFIAFYKAYMVDSVKGSGGTPAEVNEAIANAEAFEKMYRNPLYRIPMVFVEMFPVGLLVSLISAAVLRNPRVLPVGAGSAGGAGHQKT